jgi:hypothetical protein
MSDHMTTLLAPLKRNAARLEMLSEPLPTATVSYEAMSGGLIWSDETTDIKDAEIIWGLRPLWS